MSSADPEGMADPRVLSTGNIDNLVSFPCSLSSELLSVKESDLYLSSLGTNGVGNGARTPTELSPSLLSDANISVDNVGLVTFFLDTNFLKENGFSSVDLAPVDYNEVKHRLKTCMITCDYHLQMLYLGMVIFPRQSVY